MGTLKSVCSSLFAFISHDKYEHTHLRVPIHYTQYVLIKNGRIKNQHSDFEKNKEPALSILDLKNRFTF